MNTQHTPAPWPEPVCDEWGGWEKSSSLSLGMLGLDDYKYARACVNACAGIPADWMENKPVGIIDAIVVSCNKEISALKQQNADLLAALNEIAWRRHPSEKCSAAVEKLEKIALQAIAKVGAQ